MNALLLSLSLAAAPPVALMPLVADEGASDKHAAGMDLRLREIVEEYDFIELLPLRERDDKRADRCKGEARCLGKLAHRRGAELLAVGTVAPDEAGFVIALSVVRPGGDEVVREARALVGGDAAKITRALDLLARQALAPEEIFAHISVRGEPEGSEVRIDDELIGRLPLPELEHKVVAGEHVVEISKQGYDTLRRRVKPGFRDVEIVEIELSATLEPGAAEGPEVPPASIALFASGGGAAVLGALAGTFALLDAREVERRAEAQQLVFPRDEGLLLRGQALAWTANALYLAGIGLAAGGAFVWMGAEDEDA